ncbi:hypothetical protein KAH94_05740 [bacterium]|nr:hypothetical protein [bacterium]
MSKKNIKKIFIGIVLILLALFCAITAFYFLEVKPKLALRRHSKVTDVTVLKKSSQEGVLKILEETEENFFKNTKEKVFKKKPVLKKSKDKTTQEGVINLNALVRESKAVYSESEKNRKEGILWVDRKTQKLVVTLGAVHGLALESHLTVYDGNFELGQVKVDVLFDVISYVQPEDFLDLSERDYYRIISE